MPTQASLKQAVLSVQNLAIFIQDVPLVKNISFDLFPGERVCLIGASGSGKSLTAKAIIGALPPQASVHGNIYLHGQDVAQKHVFVRTDEENVSAVFQDSSTALNPLMRIGKQLSLLPFKIAKQDLQQLIMQLGLNDVDQFLQRYPAELSGGQRQRLCIALSLLCKTSVLVADEPTTALDVLSQQHVLHYIEKQFSGENAPALLFITHDIAVAASLCHRALVMQEGQIIESASMTDLLMHPQHSYTKKLIDAAYKSSQLAPFILPEVMA